MRHLISISLGLFLSAGTALAEWTPNLQTVEGRAEFLLYLAKRRPGIALSTLQSGVNLDEVLAKVPSVLGNLRWYAGSTEVGPRTRITAEYAPGGAGAHDPKRIEEAKGKLRESLSRLRLESPQGLAYDLESIRTVLGNDQAAFQQVASDLFRVLPFLYDGEGRPLRDPAERISALSVAGLQRLHANGWESFRPLIERLSKKAGMGACLQIFDGATRRFVEGDLKRAIALYDAQGKAVEKRAIALETIPAAEAIFRTHFAPDCSLTSLPYWPLLKDAKAYAIQGSQDPNAPPKGYALVVPAQAHDETLPYLLTINGETLTADDVDVAMKLIAKDWKKDKILLPDVGVNKNIVNPVEIREALRRAPGTSVSVKLSEGHEKLTPYDRLSPLEGRSFYDGTRLKRPTLVSVTTGGLLALPEVSVRPAEPAHVNPAEISLLDRAFLAAHSVQRASGSGEKQRLLSLYGVTQTDVDAALPILQVRPPHALSVADFLRARDRLGFQAEHLANLDTQSRAFAIGSLYRERPDLADAATWRKLTAKTYAKLERDMAMLEHNPMAVQVIYDAKMALPFELSPLQGEMTAVLADPASPRNAPLRAAVAIRERHAPRGCRPSDWRRL